MWVLQEFNLPQFQTATCGAEGRGHAFLTESARAKEVDSFKSMTEVCILGRPQDGRCLTSNPQALGTSSMLSLSRTVTLQFSQMREGRQDDQTMSPISCTILSSRSGIQARLLGYRPSP